MSELKFCRDCKHYCERIGFYPDECNHPMNVHFDLVTGNDIRDRPPSAMRIDGACGRAGMLFEAAKEPT